MKLSELINKLQHEQVHANARGEDPKVYVRVLSEDPDATSGAVTDVVPGKPGLVWLWADGDAPVP